MKKNQVEWRRDKSGGDPRDWKKRDPEPEVGTGLRQERSSFLSTRRREKKVKSGCRYVCNFSSKKSKESPSQMHSIFYKEEQVRIFAKREEV